MDKVSGIFKAKDFACYIKDRYYKYTDGTKEISPIKLQKALYFCFAYWGGFVNKGKIDNQLPKETRNTLFDDKFEAWAYGPVVPSVYFNEKYLFFRTKEQDQEAVKRVEIILNNDDLLKDTIASLLVPVILNWLVFLIWINVGKIILMRPKQNITMKFQRKKL